MNSTEQSKLTFVSWLWWFLLEAYDFLRKLNMIPNDYSLLTLLNLEVKIHKKKSSKSIFQKFRQGFFWALSIYLLECLLRILTIFFPYFITAFFSVYSFLKSTRMCLWVPTGIFVFPSWITSRRITDSIAPWALKGFFHTYFRGFSRDLYNDFLREISKTLSRQEEFRQAEDFPSSVLEISPEVLSGISLSRVSTWLFARISTRTPAIISSRDFRNFSQEISSKAFATVPHEMSSDVPPIISSSNFHELSSTVSSAIFTGVSPGIFLKGYHLMNLWLYRSFSTHSIRE